MKGVWERCLVIYLVVSTLILVNVKCISSDYCQYNQVLAPQALPGETSTTTMAETGRQFVKLSESFHQLNKFNLKNKFMM